MERYCSVVFEIVNGVLKAVSLDKDGVTPISFNEVDASAFALGKKNQNPNSTFFVLTSFV